MINQKGGRQLNRWHNPLRLYRWLLSTLKATRLFCERIVGDIFYGYPKKLLLWGCKTGRNEPLFCLQNYERQSEAQINLKGFPPNIATNQTLDHTIYSQIGVGVYKGEVVAIQKWVMGNHPPSWLVYKLQHQNLNRLPDSIPWPVPQKGVQFQGFTPFS